MSKLRRQQEQDQAPDFVKAVHAAVSGKLGRPAIIRKVNNQKRWYVTDLAFSYFQRADRNRNIGYRCGFEILQEDDGCLLLFTLVHSPVMATFFKANVCLADVQTAAKQTYKYRQHHILTMDYELAGTRNNRVELNDAEISQFLLNLQAIAADSFNDHLFPAAKRIKSAATPHGRTAGHYFTLLLADDFRHEQARPCVEAAWHLFLALYPAEPLFERTASLNRSMRVLPRVCEFRAIRNLPKTIQRSACDGTIEAAHIQAYVEGGSDRLENGLWLCQRHHRLTERRIKGKRDLDVISVTYTEL